MARIAGARGGVVGIDVDADTLAIACEAAIRARVRADFRRADAARPVEIEAFDLVYARLLLSHLVDPAAAVRAMRSEVRPGGAAAVEDLFLGTLRSQQPVPALDRLQEVNGATVRSAAATRRSGRVCPRCLPPRTSRTCARRPS